MVVRLPQEKIAAKKPAISMSCFWLYRCGTLTGSPGIKEGRLYSATFRLRNVRRSSLTDGILQVLLQIVHVFDADAQPDERIAQAIGQPLFPGNGRMRHAGRM